MIEPFLVETLKKMMMMMKIEPLEVQTLRKDALPFVERSNQPRN